jgi:hypothetical protein
MTIRLEASDMRVDERTTEPIHCDKKYSLLDSFHETSQEQNRLLSSAVSVERVGVFVVSGLVRGKMKLSCGRCDQESNNLTLPLGFIVPKLRRCQLSWPRK